jgi:hypothetical protein
MELIMTLLLALNLPISSLENIEAFPLFLILADNYKSIKSIIVFCRVQTRSEAHHLSSLEHLKDITENFSRDRILGEGGSGVIYKVRANHLHFSFGKYFTMTQK